MNTFLLALRNLLRNRRRSLTTLLAMVIGLSAILLFGGYSRNITYGLQTGMAQRVGHLQIQHKDFLVYGNGNAAAYGFTGYERIIDAVKRDPVLGPMLAVVTPTLQVSGIAGNFTRGVSRTVLGNGTVAEEQNRMLAWNEYGFPLIPDRVALSGTGADAAVIGHGVARVLQLCGPLNVPDCPQSPPSQEAAAGDMLDAPDDIARLSALETTGYSMAKETRIEMLAANAHGAPNVAGLNVVKAEVQGVKEFDDMYIGLHLAQAQKLIYGNAEPRATAILLQLKHTGDLQAAKARLNHLLSTRFKEMSLTSHDFATLNPRYGQSVAMFGAIFGFIALLIGAIVLFTVSNTMSMAVVERTVEIGTLRAIGLRRSGIRRLFVCEGALLGILGAVSGIAVAVVLAAAVNRSGLTWIPPGYAKAVPLTIYVWGEASLIVGCAAGLVLVAALSAFWPAHRASKMVVVDALRHV